MTDKEVGKLWRHTQIDLACLTPLAIEYDVVALIGKLVEERANLIVRLGHADAGADSLHWALSDFGIDPATWKSE
jgi:hypothetical protein